MPWLKRALTGETAQRIALGGDRLLEDHAFPVVLVAVEGVAHHCLDLAPLRAVHVAVEVQPIVGAHSVQYLIERQCPVLEREAREIDTLMPRLEPGEDVAFHIRRAGVAERRRGDAVAEPLPRAGAGVFGPCVTIGSP